MQMPDRAPIRARLCCLPSMDDFTRRQALRLGAGALALGVVRPSPADAASLFEARVPGASVLRAPRRFSLVGLRWSSGSVRAQVRARRLGGRWTAWTPLPTGHGPANVTDPAYVGPSDEVQFRLHGSARGLRAALRGRRPRAAARARAPPSTRRT